MRTSVDIADPLFCEAKKLARQRSLPLKAIVETALRRFLEQEQRRSTGGASRLRDASVDGEGLQPEVREADWTEIRDRIYAGRGA